MVGTEQRPGRAPFALLARERDGGLVYAGSAFVGLGKAERDAFWTRAEHPAADKPALRQLRNYKARWRRLEMRRTGL